jgi:methylenetetrahydrofolate dehydrogenase (NADP+)/methenyltetrahydrofolate cyclohydrolase
MTAEILDGRLLAKQMQKEIADQVEFRLLRNLPAPGLAIIIVGEDPASKLYVSKKCQACAEVGIIAEKYELPAETKEEDLLILIEKLNCNWNIDGILVQLPLPKHIDTNKVLELIIPDKDVDGFNPYNLGRLAQGNPFMSPATSRGIMTLLQKNIDRDLQGIDATVIGHSIIVGRPMALELLAVNATVSICHKYTKDIKPYVAKADLLVSATGVPELIKGDWIKEGAIVVDAGIIRLDNGKIVGDVEFEKAKQRASWITPVPGGVGPMTVATLLQNTLFAANEFHS